MCVRGAKKRCLVTHVKQDEGATRPACHQRKIERTYLVPDALPDVHGAGLGEEVGGDDRRRHLGAVCEVLCGCVGLCGVCIPIRRDDQETRPEHV